MKRIHFAFGASCLAIGAFAAAPQPGAAGEMT